MTLHRFPDRTKHEGPYYGYELKRLLLEESLVERNRGHEWRWVACVVVIAAIAFAVLVNL